MYTKWNAHAGPHSVGFAERKLNPPQCDAGVDWLTLVTSNNEFDACASTACLLGVNQSIVQPTDEQCFWQRRLALVSHCAKRHLAGGGTNNKATELTLTDIVDARRLPELVGTFASVGRSAACAPTSPDLPRRQHFTDVSLKLTHRHASARSGRDDIDVKSSAATTLRHQQPNSWIPVSGDVAI